MDTNGVKTELLIQHYLSLGGPNGVPIDSPTLLIHILRNLKSKKIEITEKLGQESLQAGVRGVG